MAESDRKADPQFTQPVRIIVLMLAFVLIVGAGTFLGLDALLPIFNANVWLNGFIGMVFIFGIIACFWQAFTLVSSVSWIEGFALDRPGHEFVQPPGLLASLAAYLRKRGARYALTASSTSSILDSVAVRLDEGREITRYVINLLIFLGLLGTFYGLATTVPAVVDTIRSLAPTEDGSTIDVFDNLMSGLERQLGGMGTAFGSSLLGLAGSLVVGLLDLMAGRGQNRFYGELEEWLSSITRIGVAHGEADLGGVENFAVADMLENTSYQIETLQELVRTAVANRDDADRRIDQLTALVERMAAVGADNEGNAEHLDQLAASVERLVENQSRDTRLAKLAEAVEKLAGAQAADTRVDRLAGLVERLAQATADTSAASEQLAERIADGQARAVAAIRALPAELSRERDEVWDSEARMRLRNIDTQLLRILEEMTSNRQETLGDLRSDLLGLTRTLREALDVERKG